MYSLEDAANASTVGRLAEEAASALRRRDGQALHDLCLSAGTARAIIVDEEGVALADSLSLLNGQLIAQPEVLAALESGESQKGRYIVREGDSTEPAFAGFVAGERAVSVYAAPVGEDGAVCLIADSEDARQAILRVMWRVLLIAAGTVAIALVAGLIVARWVTVPLRRLSAGIESMTRGDFKTRVEAAGHDEFAQLSRSFNQMCDRIQHLDKARGQFVSNASHELRTPLSTIKILTQTVLYQEPMDPVMAKEFLGDIDSEIDRLNSIISDLLTLVSLDNDAPVQLKPLNVGQLLDETTRRLQPLARERGIEMTLNIRDQIPVSGESGQLTRVFYNLIDNAIKYTGRGGHIRIECQRKDRKAVIRVADTGIGIPAEDQQHVFDRFYRVDKARSRETGGTGLGLSIVRQIVLMHGGTVYVSSDGLNKGSTFTVELPELS